jgi:peptidoglycan/LPS O-acetylase OafA/YrhL
MTSTTLSSKPHYQILDGLRGVAAVMVVTFHIFEAHATSRFDQMMNHGYLAVDFFFLLSGFVIGYAYDDRWAKISIKDFFKFRLIRLQPMVIMGMIIGAVCFYFQDSVFWPDISEVPVWKMLMVMAIGFTLIPVPPSMDIRGWIEMHPLNGPAWSLFFEYIGNILYAIGIRKFSKSALAVLVILSGLVLIHLTVTGPSGDVIGGWAFEPTQLYIGFTRLMFPFFAGLLLFRVTKLSYFNNAFLWCSLLIAIVLSVPRIGGEEHVWMNGLYESLSIILIFPLIVYIGASGVVKGRFASRICKFLGDISYPIYITHYPIIYIYTGWVHDHQHSFQDVAGVALLVLVSCILLAYLCLKLYDEPVRQWLKAKTLVRPSLAS